MGFYGNVTSAQSPFTFDRIYSSRARMETMAMTDNILVGRSILIDYNYNDDLEGLYTCEDDLEPEKGGWEKGEFERRNSVATTKEAHSHYREDYVAFKSELDSTTQTFDQTIWQKAYVKTNDDGVIKTKIKYILLSQLNPVTNEIDLNVVSHYGFDPRHPELWSESTVEKDEKMSSPLHTFIKVTKPWELRIGNHWHPNDSWTEKNGYNYHDNKVQDNNLRDIYINAAGFDKKYHHRYENDPSVNNGLSTDAINAITVQSVMGAGNATCDYKDISIILPALGNAVSDIYDLMYGYDKETGKRPSGNPLWQDPAVPLIPADYLNTNSALVKNANGQYVWNAEACETLAGAINTTNHLIGMIVHTLTADEKADKTKLYPGWIYFDPDTNKFYRVKKDNIFTELDDSKFGFSKVNISASDFLPYVYYYKNSSNECVPAGDTYYENYEYYIRFLNLSIDDLYTEVTDVNTNYEPDKYYYPDSENGFLLSATEKPVANREYKVIDEGSVEDVRRGTDFNNTFTPYTYHKVVIAPGTNNQYVNYTLLESIDDYSDYAADETIANKRVYEITSDTLTGTQLFYQPDTYYWTDGTDAQPGVGGIQYTWSKEMDHEPEPTPGRLYGRSEGMQDAYDASGNPIYGSDGQRVQYQVIRFLGELVKNEPGKIYTKEYICDDSDPNRIVCHDGTTYMHHCFLRGYEGQSVQTQLNQSHYPIILKQCTRPTKEMWESDYSIFFVKNTVTNEYYQNETWDYLDRLPNIQFYVLALQGLNDDLSNWRECEAKSCSYYVFPNMGNADYSNYKYYALTFAPISADNTAPKNILNNTYAAGLFYYDEGRDEEEEVTGEVSFDYPAHLVIDNGSNPTSNRVYYKINLDEIQSIDFMVPDGIYYNKVNDNYIRATQDENGNYTFPLYTSSSLYVIKDTAGLYNKYAIYPYSTVSEMAIPSSVELGTRTQQVNLEEIPAFGKELSTMNGLILELSRILNTGDEVSRDVDTIQGALNRFNDLFAQFDSVAPGNIMAVNPYGRFQDAELDPWFETSSGYEDGKITMRVSHADAKNTNTTTTSMNNTNVQFGSTIKVPIITYDSKGHISSTGNETFNIPKASLTDTPSDGKVITGLTLNQNTGAFGTNRSYVGNLLLTEYNQGTNVNPVANTDTVSQAFGKLQSQILNLDYDDSDSNVTQFVNKVKEVNGKITVERAAAGTLVLGSGYSAVVNGGVKATDNLNTAFNNLDGRLVGAEKDIDDLEGLVGDTAVATQITDAIKALDVNDTEDTTKFISSVTETDGKVSIKRATAGTLTLGTYNMPDSYSAIGGSDNLGTAIGKLEKHLAVLENDVVKKVNASGYDDILTKTSANSTYVKKSDAAGYGDILTQTSANDTYVKKSDATGYGDILTASTASSTYLTITNASDTYLAKTATFIYNSENKTLQEIITSIASRLSALESAVEALQPAPEDPPVEE